MKYTILLLIFAFIFVGGFEAVNAQDKKEETKKQISFPGIQKSPTDISYMREGRRGPVTAKVIYSRPYKKDRVIFGGLVPYGQVWRTGADEATEITFYRDVMFGDKEIKAGTYSIFTVPDKDSWEVRLNSGLHQWGAYSYDDSMDVASVKAKPAMMDEELENFTIVFDDGNMILAWDKTMVAVPIKAK